VTVNGIVVVVGAITGLVTALTGLVIAFRANGSIKRVEHQVTPSNGTKLAGIIERTLGERDVDKTGDPRPPIPESQE
jgi:hypothetical protein